MFDWEFGTRYSENPLGHPLATSLNGHSQSGIGPCQANYTAFARAIGADPAKQANLRCDMSNSTWVKALFDTMLDPKQIDYWWTDYGGCASPTVRTLLLLRKAFANEPVGIRRLL
jgi:hypothetical protein